MTFKKTIRTALLAGAGLAAQTHAAVLFETGFNDLSGWTTSVDSNGVLEASAFANPGTCVASYRKNDNGSANIVNTLTRTIDTTGHTNLVLNLKAFQHSGTFEGSEYLEIEVDYGTGFVSLLKSYGVWDGASGGGAGRGNASLTSTGDLPLDPAAGNGSFDLRITLASGFFANGGTIYEASEVYYLDHLSIEEYTAPLPDKVVNISGIYPHLALSNDENGEVGVGAIVPWANRLWAITYTGHAPYGSSDKLWEITPGLDITARSESIGGTPANRFIHTASQQLNIGSYFIDTNRTVRVLPYTSAQGRPTATAAHLTDPDNRLYIMTMENGVYDINVNDLSFTTRYPDIQGKGDQFLFGYHGKGLYSGQGSLFAANNGRPALQNDPSGPAGVLASWDGTTVADNGGSYFVGNDPNTDTYKGTVLDNRPAAVSAKPDYIAGWHQYYKVQHCEVTGPGGIYGNPNPATDPIWALGFDEKSVVVRVMEDGTTWNTWRLPKGSYSHDGSHGWHTEWPRIRQLDPSDPASIYLMHMHGIFYDFPKSFSSTNFAGLSPICDYYKVPTDYCMFNGQIVMGKDDASLFDNPLTLRTQSNLWFGQLDDLKNWGAPQGFGGVWMHESLPVGTISEPFLVNGFSRIALHLKHDTAQPITIEVQTSNGDKVWTSNRTVTVAAAGYAPELMNDLSSPWIRLKAINAASNLTAQLILGNPYPHAQANTDKYAAIPDVGSATAYSDGLLRVMASPELQMEMAAATATGDGAGTENGYHVIGGPMVLDATPDAGAEANLRSAAAISKNFSSDAASVWIIDDITGERLRLPRLDPAYGAPVASGWARDFREVVTERSLLNCQGTFYEVPRVTSGGRYRMRPITSHGKRITDFTAWRGLFALTGVLDSAPETDRLVRNADGAALWLGEVDDLWQMGEPRGSGGPWLASAVTSNVPSDAYLMYGYDKKKLELSHEAASAVTFTVQVDFMADYSWSAYTNLTVQPGETLAYAFPEGFSAHWVRVVSDTTTTASAVFTYGAAPSEPTELRTDLLVEAEAFSDNGGWLVDQQFMDLMGSPFLMAHGLGEPVANAATEIEVPAPGSYRKSDT